MRPSKDTLPALLLHASSGPSVAADKESSFRRDAKTQHAWRRALPRGARYFTSTSIGRVKRFAHAA